MPCNWASSGDAVPAGAVQSRLLMRVFRRSVGRAGAAHAEVEHRRQAVPRGRRRGLTALQARQRSRYRAVVGGRRCERLLGQSPVRVGGERAFARLQFCGHSRVVVRVGHHRDVPETLRRSPDQGGAADVDVLDHLVERRVGVRRGLCKGVEVDHDQVDRLDPVPPQRLDVPCVGADCEHARRDVRVQRLHAAVQHFGKPRDLRDIYDFQSCLPQRPGGPARGH